MTPGPAVAIHGGGVAAECCHRLLERHGATVCRSQSSGPSVPAVMLSQAALGLLRDCLGVPGLFAEKPVISRRIVVWGGDEPIALPHQAVMLGAGDLEFGLAPQAQASHATDISIHTTGFEHGAKPMRFGDRSGDVASVRLLREEDQGSCWIEATENGWLFMIPASTTMAWLLSIGAPGERLLKESRHLARRIELQSALSRQFDTTPRMLLPMARDGWLACGSASMAFDPICGDGTAMAAKQAILASAVALAIGEGEDPTELVSHYQAMMIASMRRHLRLCLGFYDTGGDSSWWRAQRKAIMDGFARCSRLLEREPPPRFALQGFRLVRRELAA